MYKSQPVGQMHAMGKEILRQTYKGLLKKYVLPRRYTFYEVKPKVNLHFKFNYYDDWKSTHEQKYTINFAVYICLFFTSFLIAHTVTDLMENPRDSYYLYVQYPIQMKLIELTLADLKYGYDKFESILPKNRYDVALAFSKFYTWMSRKEQRIAKHDKYVKILADYLYLIDKELNPTKPSSIL